VWDGHGDLSAVAQTDPQGRGGAAHRVYRGGCYTMDALSTRVAVRSGMTEDWRRPTLGFRLGRSVP